MRKERVYTTNLGEIEDALGSIDNIDKIEDIDSLLEDCDNAAPESQDGLKETPKEDDQVDYRGYSLRDETLDCIDLRNTMMDKWRLYKRLDLNDIYGEDNKYDMVRQSVPVLNKINDIIMNLKLGRLGEMDDVTKGRVEYYRDIYGNINRAASNIEYLKKNTQDVDAIKLISLTLPGFIGVRDITEALIVNGYDEKGKELEKSFKDSYIEYVDQAWSETKERLANSKSSQVFKPPLAKDDLYTYSLLDHFDELEDGKERIGHHDLWKKAASLSEIYEYVINTILNVQGRRGDMSQASYQIIVPYSLKMCLEGEELGGKRCLDIGSSGSKYDPSSIYIS